MPEYRRFVAYFYEYINGKKQKNAGFAKVELRNGMWRILFRLTTEFQPEPPIAVYGFVREQGYLLGLPFGVMRPGREIAEEWAYRSEHTFGTGKYRFADLAGIRIQSGDDRCFITVWDDEGLNLEKFVLEIPKEAEVAAENAAEKVKRETTERKVMEKAGNESEGTGREKAEENVSEGAEIEKTEENAAERAGREKAEEKMTEGEQRREAEIKAAEVPKEKMADDTAEVPESKVTDETVKVSESKVADDTTDVSEKSVTETTGVKEMEIKAQKIPENHKNDICADIFQKRQHFQPFSDDEMKECVQILPCDIVRLQQDNWQVGRSSFLQHGFYQYRHLLMGRTADGTYILGVPGIRSQQESYMAQMFGFDRFKTAKMCECGRAFGYWCRKLER